MSGTPRPGSPKDTTGIREDRERFLSRFALALVGEADVPGLLDGSIEEIGRLLAADRAGLFLVEGAAPKAHVLVRAIWTAEGVAGLPSPIAPFSPERIAEVFADLAPIASADVLSEPRLAPEADALRGLGTRSALVVPIVLGGVPCGFLSAASVREPREWTAEETVFLETAARHLSAALKQIGLLEELARQRDRVSILLDVAAAVQRSTTEEEVIETALEGLRETLGFRAAFFALLTPSGDEAVSVGMYANDRSEPGRGELTWRRRLDQGGAGPKELTLQVLQSGHAIVVGDIETDPRAEASRPLLRSLGVGATAVFPMRAAGRLVGIAAVGGPAEEWDVEEEDVVLLQSLADFVGVAIDQRRAAEAISRAAFDLEERTHVLEVVTRATQLLNFRLHTPDVLSSVIEETSRAFPGAVGGVVYVANADGTALTVAAVSGLGVVTERAWEKAPIPLTRLRCAGPAFTENRAVLLEVAGLDELVAGQPAEVRARARSAVDDPEIRQLMAVPIRVADHRLGVLEVLAGRPGVFAAKDAETLGLLAEQSAIALRNARLVEELQRSNRLKDDFLANLSHEVRTPLTGIVGWTEVLLDSGPKDTASRRALEAILGQATTLSRMLTDLIDLSRIDNFGLEIRHATVRLAETIAAAFDAVAPSAKKKGVPVLCAVAEDLPALDGDPARLQQVIWNLLTNAVKFSPPGKTVRLAARALADGGVELVVEDDGAGIDPAFLPQVFDRFRQEETSSSRPYGGLGVGLSIARAIVEAHGGSIEVESQGRDHGSRFRVVFPPKSIVRSGSFRRKQLLGREEGSPVEKEDGT